MERSRITRKLDLDAFYQVGFKMICLLFNSKLTGVSSDGVRPGPSRDTLMCLHCIDWILKQNLRIQSQSPEQKLCYKARWFYGMVTSRPFTYLEPSGSRSSGASLNRIVEIYVPVSSSWYLEPNETWHVIFVGFPTMFELIWHHQQTLPSVTLKSLRFSKNPYVGPHWFLANTVKTKKCMYVNMETRKHVPA